MHAQRVQEEYQLDKMKLVLGLPRLRNKKEHTSTTKPPRQTYAKLAGVTYISAKVCYERKAGKTERTCKTSIVIVSDNERDEPGAE
ncbi:hypothetical protein PAXRUDRAFT_822889 [Paxillus rubicundulus Ve08.2h10]|uniref:Uncharacterized protein n=1 Tax=Paxillus rubicundulus Ve08.2h10 TaxID=930991 RepID=A0A0D0E9E2_9AGAM|nr:hypothetical protein PAXRUDRAFT_822889 [Paxillus rubicundulus Ve08.2h10]